MKYDIDTTSHNSNNSFSYSTESIEQEGQQLKNAFGYCATLVRRHDYDGYLCTISLPKERRPAAFALRAFNVETAQAVESAKEPALAEMRLMFWKETVRDIFQGKTPPQPVARALLKVVQDSRPSKMWFDRILSTRVEDLQRGASPPEDLKSIEAYAEGTSSALLYLLLQTAGVRDTTSDHAASHVGKALGLCTLLRGTAHLAARRTCYLPADLMMKNGVSQESLYRGEGSQELSDVVFEVASTAKAHLHQGRAFLGKLPNEAYPVLLPTVHPDMYLDALEKCHFNVFDPSLAPGSRSEALKQIRLQINIGWHAWKRTF